MPRYLDEMEANAPAQVVEIGKPSGTSTGTTKPVSTVSKVSTGGTQNVSGSTKGTVTKTKTTPSGGVAEYQVERDRAIIEQKQKQRAADKAERVAASDPLGAITATAVREAVPTTIETSETQQFMPVQGEPGTFTRMSSSGLYKPRAESDNPQYASEAFKSPGRYNPPSVPAKSSDQIHRSESEAAAEAERPDPRSPEGLMIAAARVAAKQGQVNDSMEQAAERKSQIERVIRDRLQDAYVSQPAFTVSTGFGGGAPPRTLKAGEHIGQVERLRFGPTLPGKVSGVDAIPYKTLTDELQKTEEYIARLNNLDLALGAIRSGTLRGVTPSDREVAKQRAAIGQFETDFYEGARPEEVQAAKEAEARQAPAAPKRRVSFPAPLPNKGS
mgnify:CR=1 FL=1